MNTNGAESQSLNPIEIQEETSNTTGNSAIPADNMELYSIDGIESYPSISAYHSIRV